MSQFKWKQYLTFNNKTTWNFWIVGDQEYLKQLKIMNREKKGIVYNLGKGELTFKVVLQIN